VIRRTSIIAIELLAGLIGVAAIAFALLFWRLTAGPISLAFATPYIERAMSVEQAPISVKIQDTDLIWAGWDNAFNIRIRDTTIRGGGGKVLAILPEVSVDFSITALLRGVVAPSRLEIEGLSATVERGLDGKIDLGFFSGAEAAADREFIQSIPTYIRRLAEPSRKTSSFGYLRVIRLSEIDIRYRELSTGVEWHAPDADLEFLREADNLEAIASLALDFGEISTRITGHAVFARGRPVVDIGIEFEDLIPAYLADRLPILQALERIDTPFSGQLRVLAQQTGQIDSVAFDLKGAGGTIAGNVIVDSQREFDVTMSVAGLRSTELAVLFPEMAKVAALDALIDAQASGRISANGEIRRLEIETQGGAGSLQVPKGLPGPLEFERFQFKANIQEDFAEITLTDAAIVLGGPALSLDVTAHRIGDELSARIEAVLSDLPMAELEKYWPVGLAESARRWTTVNIRSGTVDEGTLGLAVQVPLKRPEATEVQSLSGTLGYSDLSVAYFADFPKVTGIAGTAAFSHDQFNLDIIRGQLLDVRVESGVIKMSRLDSDSEQISIDLVMRGPLAAALAIANRKPLGLVGEVGIDPSAVGGEMAARLGFRFPLRSDVSVDQVTVSAAANLRDVNINPGPFGYQLSNADLELKLANSAMKVGGQVRLNGVPLTVDWHELFSDAGAFRSRYIISGELDRASLQQIGLPDLSFMGGRSDINFILTNFIDGRREILAAADLKETVLSLPEMSWLKPAGQAGSVNMGLTVDSVGTIKINNLQISAGDLDLNANADLKRRENYDWSADISRFNLGATRLRGNVRQGTKGEIRVRVDGGTLDVEPFLLNGTSEARERKHDANETKRSLVLDLKLDEVRTSPDSRLGPTEAQARLIGGNLDMLLFEAKVSPDRRLNVSYVPDQSGHVLEIYSDDAGASLKRLGWSDKMVGGELRVSGRRAVDGESLKGDFKVSNYNLSNAPALARLLQVASLTGIFDALKKGLDFVSFDGKFAYRDKVLLVDQSRTFGSSIGITVEGTLDLEEDLADLSGTVVPAYTVNRVLGQIPILGPILTGGENEGIFAATYAVTGPLEDPAIAVNPLSALAPGFLRNLFSLIGGGSGASQPASTTPSVK
jgi:hypothetical protein